MYYIYPPMTLNRLLHSSFLATKNKLENIDSVPNVQVHMRLPTDCAISARKAATASMF